MATNNRPALASRLVLYGVLLSSAAAAAWFWQAGRDAERRHATTRRVNFPLDPAAKEILRRDATVGDGAVVFLGDSLTYNLDVRQLAPDAVNYGISGYRTRQLLQLLPRLRSIRHARLVVLTIGTNDVKHGQSAGIDERMRDISKAIPGPLLWNAIPPSRHGDVRPFNAAARAACEARTDCRFLETRFLPSDFWDGEHHNEAGRRRWIDSIRAAWPERLAQPEAARPSAPMRRTPSA